MANPHSVVPYHDPYDSPMNYDFLNFMSDSNFTLANLSSPDEPSSYYPSANDIADPIHPFDDPMVWNIYDRASSATMQSQEAGPSRSYSGREADNTQASNLGDSRRPISFWPLEPAPFRCTCCQVLREIIHTDVAGNCAAKLEIHGRLGMICHAILENKDHVNTVSSESQYPMIEDCRKSEPNRGRQRGGKRVENQSSTTVQSERTGKLTLKDFEDYFHLPIEEAARRMNLCPTVVKKICRRAGMTRWPYRKVKSIQRQISNLRAISNSNDADERARAQAEIQGLRAQISNGCAGATN